MDKKKVWVVIVTQGGVPGTTRVFENEDKANEAFKFEVIENGSMFDPDDEDDKSIVDANPDNFVLGPKTGCYYCIHSENYDCYLYEEEME